MDGDHGRHARDGRGTAARASAPSASRSRREPSHSMAYPRAPGPESISATSVMPYQLTTAAGRTVHSGTRHPGVRSRRVRHRAPAVEPGGRRAAAPWPSARWPPAESPLTTMRAGSKPWSCAYRATQRSAQRTSSTAAGAWALARQPVLDVHRRPSRLQPRDQPQDGVLLGPAHPAAAVDEHQRRTRRAEGAGPVDVELQLRPARDGVRDVGERRVLRHQVARRDRLARPAASARGQERAASTTGGP